MKRGDGFVLVAVLGGLLVVGAVAFALLFTASLDALAARSVQRAAVEREALEGALHLAAAELALSPALVAAASGGTLAPLGPWPELGSAATVTVGPLAAAGGLPVLELVARLPPPAGRAPEVMLLSPPPALAVLRRAGLDTPVTP